MGNCYPFRNVPRSISSKQKLLVLVIGGPCSGKSSVTQHLSTHFQLLPISADQIIRECVDRESLKIPETRLERLHRRRLRTYNALLIHNKMTKEEKEFLGKGESVGVSMSSNHFSLHRQSDSEEDLGCPPNVLQIQKSLNRGEPINPDLISTLIHDTMWYAIKSCNGFVIDGYPRDVDQFESLCQTIGDPHLIVFLECPDKLMIERALKRAQMQQRYDDNEPFLSMKIRSFHRNVENLSEKWTDKEITVLRIKSDQDTVEQVKHECGLEVERNTSRAFSFKRFRDWNKIIGEKVPGRQKSNLTQ